MISPSEDLHHENVKLYGVIASSTQVYQARQKMLDMLQLLYGLGHQGS